MQTGYKYKKMYCIKSRSNFLFTRDRWYYIAESPNSTISVCDLNYTTLLHIYDTEIKEYFIDELKYKFNLLINV